MISPDKKKKNVQLVYFTFLVRLKKTTTETSNLLCELYEGAGSSPL
jgi:hypothetical protein